MCRHDLYAGFDPDGCEVIVACADCDREQEWADEDEADQQLTQLQREDRPDGYF